MERLEQEPENGAVTLAPIENVGASVHLTERSPAADVLVAIPAFNEERFIGSVVLEVRLKGYAVLVVDDGSKDRTAEVAAAAGATVEQHERNLGKAEAVNTAFRSARAMGVGVLVLMDGDSQHSPAEIDILVAPVLAGQADIVIGSRYLTTSQGRIPGLRSIGQV
jgi:glycosyltransferase involved in cell wall biosynthesis